VAKSDQLQDRPGKMREHASDEIVSILLAFFCWSMKRTTAKDAYEVVVTKNKKERRFGKKGEFTAKKYDCE